MTRFNRVFLIWGLICLLAGMAFAQIQSPEEFLGFKVGTDRKLADMKQIIVYFQKLGQSSDRILVQEVGRTTMDNPFIVAYITSSENHADLEKYRTIQQRLADPRRLSEDEAERLIRQGRAVVMINCSLHASEIAASQMSMQLAYDLATLDDPETLRILDNVILILTPMHNPDGVQMVVDWYRKQIGTPFEGGRMPWLYHKYVGHDNNRDWFMFTQQETRLTIQVHNAWHPQIIVDMHQMGSTGARLFVPPFVDPYEPNIDPILRQQVAVMGTFMAAELTAQGKAGVMHSSRYDAWTPARAYHHYHGGIRILTEAASARVATPVTITPDQLQASVRQESVRMPLPWNGGRWALSDIVDYDYAAAHAVLNNAAGLRENWVRNYFQVFVNAVNRLGPPYAYVVPQKQRDLSTTVKMLNILKMGGVEIDQANRSFSADGFDYPADTYVVKMAQPFGGFAKTLLERQVYPELRDTPGGPLKTPYDVVGHTLPLLMGVDAIEVELPFEADLRRLQDLAQPTGIVSGESDFGYAWGHTSNDDMVVLNRILKAGHSVLWTAREFSTGDKTYPAGTMLVEKTSDLLPLVNNTIQDLSVHFQGLGSRPEVPSYTIKQPRLGVYKSWTASMDEGWTRFVLEQFEFPYESLLDRDIRQGELEKKFDVIIFPDLSEQAIVKGLSKSTAPEEYIGGIGEVGIRNIKDFVGRGGALITLNSAAEFALKNLHLGIEDKVSGLDRKEFFIPGSLLKVIHDTTHPIAYGYGRDAAVFFRRSPVFEAGEGHTVISYPAHSLLSGWVTGEQFLVNRSALVDVPFAKGRVILIGFPAQYRSQSHGSFRYLFNSIFYGAADPPAGGSF